MKPLWLLLVFLSKWGIGVGLACGRQDIPIFLAVLRGERESAKMNLKKEKTGPLAGNDRLFLLVRKIKLLAR